MINAEEYFEDLLIKVIEGVANEDEFATFMEIVRLDADLRSRYVQEMRFQAILSFQGEVGEKGNAGNRQSAAGCGDVSRRGAEARSHGGWWKAAAAAAVLLGGAGVWQSSVLCPRFSGSPPASVPDVPRVALVSQSGAAGLELPAKLPGEVRLASGMAKVRLPSGVELALQGPLELRVESGMEVRLASGRLLAWVPPRASGFTVHAQGLTARDIGTVFAVAADNGRSGFLVFKGKVQMQDDAGADADLCGAGEGALAVAGGGPVKFTADFPEVRALSSLSGGCAAMEQPEKALAAADLTYAAWEPQYSPPVARVNQPADEKILEKDGNSDNTGENDMNRTTGSLILAAALTAAGTLADTPTTWHVAPEGDDAAAGTSWEAPFKTISNAVAKAAIADEIVVSNGVYAVTVPVNVSKMLTVRALSSDPRDTIIDGGGVTNCVAISATNVWFSGFTVTNALGVQGAGLYVEFNKPGWFTLSNCVVTCCTSAGLGGGIGVNVGGTDAIVATVTDCEISHNVNRVADNWRGGGGIYQGNDKAAFTIRNCRIFGNRCPSGRGGGIFSQYGDVRDCEVFDNIAQIGGGVFSLHNGISTISGCRIYHNAATASTGGGGIACAKPVMTHIVDCVISNNAAPRGGGIAPISGDVCFTASNCLIVANQATNGYGGGVVSSTRRTQIFHSIIRENMSTTGGGGFYHSGQWTGTNETLVLNCLFEGNWVTNSWVKGGAILVNGGSNLLLSACTVVTNRSTQGTGGGLYLNQTTYGLPKIRNMIFSGNTAEQVTARPDVNVATDGDLNAFSYCFDANGLLPAAQGNVSGDPCFMDFDAKNYRLTPDSPCYNAGTNELWMSCNRDLGMTEQVTLSGPVGVRLILNGHQRICGPKVDIGAYERFYLLGTAIQVK